MNRRDLIKRLAVIIPASTSQALVTLPMLEPSRLPDKTTFHGWSIYWTGWKSIPNQIVLAGQWIAHPDKSVVLANGSMCDEGMWLYSSWPGECAPFCPGYVFNLAHRDDQTLPREDCILSDLDHMRVECLERLFRLIVRVGPPPLTHDKYQSGYWLPK